MSTNNTSSSSPNLLDMSAAEFDAWLANASGQKLAPTDGNVAKLLTLAMCEANPKSKAEALMEVANMCMALATAAMGKRVDVCAPGSAHIH